MDDQAWRNPLPVLTPLSPAEEQALRLAEEKVKACAAGDEAPDTPAILDALKETRIYGIRVPPECGGLSSGQLAHLYANEFLSRHAASASFLLQQHQGVCALIARGARTSLRTHVLARLAEGTDVATIAASHLRKGSERWLTATRVAGGYVFDGFTPWVSGVGTATHVLLAGTVANEPPVFAWLRFDEVEGLTISPPWSLWIMGDTNTVSIRCSKLFVPDDKIICRDEGGVFSPHNGAALSAATAFPLGLTARCLEFVGDWLARNDSSRLGFVGEGLAARLQRLRGEFYQQHQGMLSRPSSTIDWSRPFAVRAEASRVALTAALVAMTLVGGRSQTAEHFANRSLRDACFYVTTTTRDDVKETLVRCLAETPEWVSAVVAEDLLVSTRPSAGGTRGGV